MAVLIGYVVLVLHEARYHERLPAPPTPRGEECHS
jgi:hypothetical protein